MREGFTTIVERQGDSTTTPLGLRITKQGGGGVMIKISILFTCNIFYLRLLRYIIELLESQLKESFLFKESEYGDNI